MAFKLKSREVVRYSLDSVICLTFLGWGIGPQIGGLAGTVSNLSNMYDTYVLQKFKKNQMSVSQ